MSDGALIVITVLGMATVSMLLFAIALLIELSRRPK